MEETLDGVHHDVGASASGLVSGDGVGELRVHQGKDRATQVGVAAELVVGRDLVTGYDA